MTQVRVQLTEPRVAGLVQVLSDHLLQACMITDDVLQCGDLKWKGVGWLARHQLQILKVNLEGFMVSEVF